jgi:glycosyltransferase involved in cell wall biosynthesis
MGEESEIATGAAGLTLGLAGGQVLVSVVVATRDRQGQLELLFDALDGQTLPRERFEVIVVDDGSRDGTAALAEARADRVVRNQASMGPAGARQQGWPLASASFIAFTDDDCRPEPDWLEQGLGAHQLHPGSIVQGKTRPDVLSDIDLRTPLARSIRVDHLGPFFETCNVFYPKALLEQIGGFDPLIATAGEDADLAMRALATGCGAVFAEGAVVNHSVEVHSFSRALKGTKRWASLVPLVGRRQQLRRAFLWRGFIWRESHWRLILASVGLGLFRLTGRRLFLLWVVPYLTLRNGWYPDGLLRTLMSLPKTVPVDAAEIFVLAKASAREGRLLL